MQALKITAIASLFALGLALGIKAYAEDKVVDGAHRIVLKGVKIAETRADGKPWRTGGGKPDIIVSMKNLSDTTQKEVVTDKKSGFEVTYNSGMVLAAAGQRVRILVEDKGVVSNTAIGKTELDITEDMLKKGTTTISFAQVKELTIDFQKP
jgi:hypothetical protein